MGLLKWLRKDDMINELFVTFEDEQTKDQALWAAVLAAAALLMGCLFYGIPYN